MSAGAAPTRIVLPTQVTPVQYELTLRPDFAAFTFHGRVLVTVAVHEATSTVRLNALDLTVASAVAVQNDTHLVTAHAFDADAEVLTLTTSSPLVPGAHAYLMIDFDGILNDKMAGFYRSSYQLEGTRKWIATTQFEAVDARRCFPCWDEPAHKAVFVVTLEVPKDMMALSNTLPTSEADIDGTDLRAVRFAPTPKMSTYLLAFSIGNFEFIEGSTREGVRVRVYTTPGKSALGHFALQVATKALSFFIEYFGIDFPLKKIDMIAIPDFAAGAMENWGLITYRETAVLVDERQSSAARRVRVAEVVSHELAHQWFGNLVTMEWWEHLWLNEGFATWVAFLAMNKLFPEWRPWELFLHEETGRAFSLDSLESSHPIEVPIGPARQIDEVFDAISYSKGASVIRMIWAYLGEDAFRAGLQQYLKHFSYANASTTDLWHHLGQASGKPVAEIMRTWTGVTGFPVLHVQHAAPGRVHIAQERFFASGKRIAADAPGAPRWNVPLTFATSATDAAGETGPVLGDAALDLDVPALAGGGDAWFKLNASQAAFYRTAYDDDLFARLVASMQSLPTIDRFGLANDVFALARARHVPTTRLLELLANSAAEANYVVWECLSDSIGALQRVFAGVEHIDRLKTIVRKNVGPLLDKLTWEPKESDDTQTRTLRALAISMLAEADDEAVVKRALAMVTGKIDDIHADLKGTMYAIAAAHGGAAVFDQLVARMKASSLSEEQVRILGALSHVKEPELQERAFALSLSEDVRSQDAVFLIAGLCDNSHVGRRGWEFFLNNLAALSARYNGGFLFGRIAGSGVSFVVSNDDLAEVKAYFEAHPLAAIERTIQQAIERAELRVRWREQQAGELSSWLAANVQA